MIKVNRNGFAKARSLINAGKIDAESSWAFTAADGDALLGPDGNNWKEYGRWFLAVDSDAEPGTKAYYKYPYGKDGEIYRQGVIAAKSRAAQQGETAVEKAADVLLQDIDKMIGDGMGEEKPEMEYQCDKCGETHKKGDVCKKKTDSVDAGTGTAPMKSVTRLDEMTVLAPEWMIEPFTRTTEGFLKGRAIVTNVGVFEYKNADGTVRRELRLPEEVFREDSLSTMKIKPVVNLHPTEMVTSENIKKYQVGSMGSNPSKYYGPEGPGSAYISRWNNGNAPMSDGFRVANDVIITDGEAIKQVLEGRMGLSCGYKCDMEPAPAGSKWIGMPYDFIQRNIRYNHLALVDIPRAGNDTMIVLRGDGEANEPETVLISKRNFEMEESMKVIKLDGVEYQAEAKVIEALTKATERADGLESQITANKDSFSKLEAERDGLKDRLDAAEKEVVALKADGMDEGKIQAAVNARIALVETAKRAGVEKTDGVSDADLKKAVIVAVFPKANLDGKDAAYIQARFDGAAETLEEKGNAEQRQALNGDGIPATNDNRDDGEPDAEKARKAYIARLTGQSK